MRTNSLFFSEFSFFSSRINNNNNSNGALSKPFKRNQEWIETTSQSASQKDWKQSLGGTKSDPHAENEMN